ncbi:hypothetical protein SFC66_13055 [Terribacillus saccharophilus]|uniref:hypothetical protein n=1 Tax=Terribacillus saccharophilus TaxID=361277 RepID=UPI003982306C
MTLRERRKKRKKEENPDYRWDVIEVFLWVPELLLYPLRFLLWMARGVMRLLQNGP